MESVRRHRGRKENFNSEHNTYRGTVMDTLQDDNDEEKYSLTLILQNAVCQETVALTKVLGFDKET